MTERDYKARFWLVVGQIPPGRVATYGQVAELAGLPRMARAVGRCLSQLPADSRLPWHRVINAQGRISFPPDSPGYRRQRECLEQEGIMFLNGRIRLRDYQWDGTDGTG